MGDPTDPSRSVGSNFVRRVIVVFRSLPGDFLALIKKLMV